MQLVASTEEVSTMNVKSVSLQYIYVKCYAINMTNMHYFIAIISLYVYLGRYFEVGYLYLKEQLLVQSPGQMSMEESSSSTVCFYLQYILLLNCISCKIRQSYLWKYYL